MALQFSNIPESDFSGGIDARSSENSIAERFVRDLLNMDIIEKRVRTRKGYQGRAGNVPIRAVQLSYLSGSQEVCFTLDSAISLDTVVSLEKLRSSPLVVYGKSSNLVTGPFGPNNSVHYYPKFRIPTNKSLVAPSGTLTILGDEHGLGTTNMYAQLVERISSADRSYRMIFPDRMLVDAINYNVDIDYTVNSDVNAYVYFADKDAVGGQTYVHTISAAAGTTSVNIPASTHNLANFNIQVQCQIDNTSTVEYVKLDAVSINPAGTVSVTLTNNTGSTQTYYVLLSAAAVSNVATGVVAGSSTGTVTLSNLDKPWVFASIYLDVGANKELVLPDQQEYDDATGDITLSFTNNNSLARQFTVYYSYGDLRSNQLCVEDPAVVGSGLDNRPEVTIWGLEHNEIYASKLNREGWVNHIDTYRRQGEQRLVVGLGGNLFSEQNYLEAASSYSYPLLYPDLHSRSSTYTVLAPTFWDTSETPGRSRGYITSSDAARSQVRVTAVAYNPGTGYTDYTISLPNKAILDSTGVPTSLSSVISTTANLEDWLTVEDMPYSSQIGTFRITAVADGTNEIVVSVDNPNLDSSDYDDANCGGLAGIFTDRLTFLSTSPYINGDTLSSEVFGISVITAVSAAGSSSVITDITDIIQIPAGVTFSGTRTSTVVPLRIAYPDATSNVTNLVRGDMLSYTGLDRQIRVKYINPDVNRNVDIAITSNGIATVTLLSGTTVFLSEGMDVLLTEAGGHSGVHTITDIVSDTEFSYSTNLTSGVNSAVLVGKTVHIDESLEWTDSAADANYFTVESRWIPIEAPVDSFNQTPPTYIRYFDTSAYGNQKFIRSVMVQDSMFLTNGEDEVQKLDGSSLYRAGLPAWQPGLFITQDTDATARIVANNPSTTPSAATGFSFQIPTDDVGKFQVGNRIRHSFTGGFTDYTIESVYVDTDSPSHGYIKVAPVAGVSFTLGSSPLLTVLSVYRYYFRMNAVDANDNVVVSAVTGSQDHVVEIAQDAAINLKLVGFPTFDNYDYDRLEVQIYRTRRDTAGPFYLVTTIPMSFNVSTGYVNFTDAFQDENLLDLDATVSSGLGYGVELPTNIVEPPRADYTTSVDNKLILGNIRDYKQLDLQIVSDATLSNSQLAGDTILFRRDNSISATVTDMLTTAKYEWMNGTTGTVSAPTILTNQFQFTTSAATSAAVGDWIYLTYDTVATTGRDLTYSGWWQIAVVSGTTVTINVPGAAAATSYPNRYVIATDPTNIPVLLGTDGNLGMVNGDSFDIFDSMRRMSMAINSSMRMVDTALTGFEEFRPWIYARGGNDLNRAGRLVVREGQSNEDTFSVVPTFSGYQLFINSIQTTTGVQTSSSARVFASRIVVSKSNFPETFDSPYVANPGDSLSAYDINSADGQEITGIIPLFGESAFGAAQKSGILLVFKTNSVYAVNLDQAGNAAVQKLETEGLGCTAPYSISVSKNGVMFANESGIYCIRTDLTMQYIGRFMERNWLEQVDRKRLDLVQGHHYGIGKMYKMSVPITSTESDLGYIENSQVYVYNHTAEADGQMGSWGRYDNHPATGWANLGANAFFGSTGGRVLVIRDSGSLTDYRDDSSAILPQIITRPNDFGLGGNRKMVDRITAHYRTDTKTTGVQVSYSPDLEEEYTEVTQPILSGKNRVGTGIDDNVRTLVQTIAQSVGRQKCVYFSTRIINTSIDEVLELTGIDYRIAALTEKGIIQAATTRK